MILAGTIVEQKSNYVSFATTPNLAGSYETIVESVCNLLQQGIINNTRYEVNQKKLYGHINDTLDAMFKEKNNEKSEFSKNKILVIGIGGIINAYLWAFCAL